MAAAKTCNFRDYLMLRTFWRTGCRVSELLDIKPSDLECHNQVVNITKAKGNKQQRVLSDDETLKLLSEHISTQNIPPEDKHIFSIKRCQVHTIVKKYGKMMALIFTPTRSGIALPSTSSGPDLTSGGQQLLGHNNLDTTQEYS